jgi:hypothetical protein
VKAERCKKGVRVRIRDQEHPFYGREGRITDVMQKLVWVALDDYRGGGSAWRSSFGKVGGSTADIPFEVTEVGSTNVVDRLAELVEDV